MRKPPLRNRFQSTFLILALASLVGVGCATGATDPDDGEGGSPGAGGSGPAGHGGSPGVAGQGVAGQGVAGQGVAGQGVAGQGVAGALGKGGSTGVAGQGVAGEGVAGQGVAGQGVAGAPGKGGSTGVAGQGVAGQGVAGAPGKGGSTGVAGGPGSGGSAPLGASGLPVPPGAANVAKPSGTPGNITVLNWAGFKAAVSYSFDDSNSSQIQHYSDMKALGVPFTFYMWTGKSDASNAIWTTAKNDGHELGNHTQSHSSNGTASDIDAATSFIMSKYMKTPYTMAAPNGASVYTQLANGKFLINRGVSDKVIMPNDSTDRFTLPTFIPPTGAGQSQFDSSVDSARSQGGWRTMCIHGFSGGSDSAYQPVSFDGWKSSVDHAKSLGDVWIGTVETVGAYWQGQKAFGSATTMTSGSDKTWTWKLPSNFPPGKYLRVKVDGGTLKQKGVEIPWDAHGYYEIALDALSVTLSP